MWKLKSKTYSVLLCYFILYIHLRSENSHALNSPNLNKRGIWTSSYLPQSWSPKEFNQFISQSSDSIQDNTNINTNSIPNSSLNLCSNSSSKITSNVIVIPGFEETILVRDHRRIFIKPQTYKNWKFTHHALISKDIHTKVPKYSRSNNTRFVDCAESQCAPHPLSHSSHCLPLPVRSCIQRLFDILEEECELIRGQSVLALPYDWRKSLLKKDESFELSLREVLLDNDKSVIIAHESGCLKVTMALFRHPEWIDHVKSLVCVSAPFEGRRDLVNRMISGTDKRLFYESAWTKMSQYLTEDGSERRRVEMRSMESDFGIRKVQIPSSLSHEWVMEYPEPELPRHQVIQLYRSFDSSLELALELTGISKNATEFDWFVSNAGQKTDEFTEKLQEIQSNSHFEIIEQLESVLKGLHVICVWSENVNIGIEWKDVEFNPGQFVNGDGVITTESSSKCKQVFGTLVQGVLQLDQIPHNRILVHPDVLTLIAAELLR